MSSGFIRRALPMSLRPVWCKIGETCTPRHFNLQFLAASSSWIARTVDQTLFEGRADRYNGVTVDSRLEPCGVDHIQTKIDKSMKKWRKENKKCVWFKVYLQHCSWVPHLASNGFNFYYARDDFIMMFRGTTEREPELPPTIHTNLCAGSLVLNDRNQLLTVMENYYDTPRWKLPGGYVNRGEDVIDAAIREVKEETGVVAEFQSIITLRHIHKMMFGNSNVYIFVMLKSLTEDIQICQREINKCQWMEVEQFLNDPNIHEFNRSVVKIAMDYKRRGIKINSEKKSVKSGGQVRDITVMSVGDV